jgi:hypothetical protein
MREFLLGKRWYDRIHPTVPCSMHYLLITGVTLLFMFTAPFKVTMFTAISLLMIGLAGQRIAQLATGAPVPAVDVFRSIGLAFTFVVALAFAFLSAGGHFSGISVVLLLAAFLLAYVSGFKIGMGIGIVPASIVASAVTSISAALFFVFRSLV